MRTTTQLRTPAVLCLMLVLFGCNEEEFLNRVPEDRFTPATFFRTPQHVEEATTAMYPIMRSLAVGALHDYGEFRSDNTTFEFSSADRGGEAFERVDYFLLEAGDGFHNQLYNPPYTGIARANFLLDRIDGIEGLTADRRASATGEAQFFRGYFHFLLIQHFGDIVPITTIIDDDGTSLARERRQPFMDVIDDVVVPDLRAAIDNLPLEWDRSELGRANKNAARMALAKVYFHLRDYQSALPLLNDIVNSNRYVLEADYADVFRKELEENTEVIFSAQFNTGAGQGASFMINWLPISGTDITQGPNRAGRGGLGLATCSLVEAYEMNDRRRAATIDFYDADDRDPDNELLPYSVKFLDIPFPEDGGTDRDYPIFRYADVLLMQAEAALEVSGNINVALSNVNLLRARAGLGLYFPGNRNPDLDVRTVEDTREVIRRERRLELAYEGHRSYDLRRYGTYVETMLAHGEVQKMKQSFLDALPDAYTNIRELMAIPQGQIDLYMYRQNPGWD